MIKAYYKTWLLLGILIVAGGFGVLLAEDIPFQEITVTGVANIGEDPDQMYKEAMENAFQKAYSKANPSLISSVNSSGKDPVSIQRELGIVRYQVLRYWQENERFMLELKVVFGNSTLESANLSRFAKLRWTYQSDDQIKVIAKTKTAVAVNTTQTIEVIDPDKGQRLQQFKMGLNSHDFYGDQYVVREGDYIKVAKLTRYNLFKLVYAWRKKFPQFLKYYLTRDTLFIIEKSGLIKALNWEDGAVKWQKLASSQADVEEVIYNRFLITFTNSELWMVNSVGEKVWVTKLDEGLLTRPVTGGNEIFCLLKNGELKTVDRDTGRIISTWEVKNQSHNKNITLQLTEKELFIVYNENGLGHLQAYHRLTGKMLWEIKLDEAVAGSLVNTAEAIVIGVGNRFEARDPMFGIKIWEEPTYGRITKIYGISDQLLVIAWNRVYCYDFK